MSLKKKAAKGGLWVSITRVGVSVIDFVVFAYLARILTLEEFGLVGFCFIFVELANNIVNAGVNQNIIQRKKWDDDYASSTLLFTFCIGLFLAFLLLAIGAPIAHYTYSELAGYVVAGFAPVTIIISLQAVFNGKLKREFKNKEMGLAKVIATVLSGACIVVLAELGFGLWSLVIGKLVNATVELIFLFVISQFKPKLHFNKENNKELITFCLPLLWSSILSFANRRASSLMTGLALGPASFALLAAAKKGEQMLTQVTLTSINSMVLPSLARVKEGANKGDIYIKMVSITAAIVLPIFMGLAAIADPFVVIAFGDKFSDSAIYMSISAFTMFPMLLAWFLPSVLISVAKTNEAFKLTLISVISTFLVVSCTIWFGINVMLVCVVVVNFLTLPMRYKIVNKHVPINMRKLFSTVLPQCVCSVGMFFGVYGLKLIVGDYIENDILMLIVLVLAGAILYPLLALTLFYKQTKRQISEIVSLFSKKR